MSLSFKKVFPLFSLLLLPFFFAESEANVAKVVILKGDVKAKASGDAGAKDLKKDDWLDEGAVIQTAEKSFVKLIFTDQSQLNIGPASKVVISKMSKASAEDPGLITLMKGQVRTKVTKDPLKDAQGEGSSKLYIKTKSAAMGVRGTDFQAIYNPEVGSTSVVTFEGEVVTAKMSDSIVEPAQIEQQLRADGAVSVTSGKFAGVMESQERPTIPVKISPAQLETMANAENPDAVQESGSKKRFGSPIPPGVSSKIFVNTQNTQSVTGQLEKTVGKEATEIALQTAEKATAPDDDAPPPEGMVDANTGAIAPPAGGFIDMKTGLYIPPPPGSILDPNTGVYIPPANAGGFDTATGSYVPPEGFKLTSTGEFVTDKTTAPKTENAGGSGSGGTPGANAANAAVLPPPVQTFKPTEGNAGFARPDAAIMIKQDGTSSYAGAPATMGPGMPTGGMVAGMPGTYVDPNKLEQLQQQVDQKVSDLFQSTQNAAASTTNVHITIQVQQ